MRLCLSLLLLFGLSAPAEQVAITVLATTDLHGNIYPIDYFTDRPAARGLAKIATLIRAQEAENPNHLLVDCGDTIQGTPMEYVYQDSVATGKPMLPADPMMLAMNRLGFAAMAVGNHEYNYGLKNLAQARSDAKFPWLSANTVVAPGGRERPYDAYVVKTVGGVKVAIIGITTPAVPTWEKPENMGSYRFLPPAPEVRKAIAALRQRERPDLILVAAHCGIGRNLATGAPENAEENAVYDLAVQVPGIDAIVFGHTHQELASATINGVLLTQPRNWGMSLARMDFTLERSPGGRWTVTGKRSRLIPVTAATVPAADILEIARPYHEMAERHLAQPVATAPRELEGTLGRVEDTPLVDAIQLVQLYYTHADVSFTSLFNPGTRVPQGRVTVRQIAALYSYDNELYVIEGNGKMMKDALENSARYFLSCTGARCSQPPLVNRQVMGFNYDMAEGVDYEIDLTQPEGSRIRNLRWHGKPLAPDQKLRIAVNNYRAAGSAGYSMFRGARIVWHSQEEIRNLIVRYYGEQGALPEKATNNWRVVPNEARLELEREAREVRGRHQSR